MAGFYKTEVQPQDMSALSRLATMPVQPRKSMLTAMGEKMSELSTSLKTRANEEYATSALDKLKSATTPQEQLDIARTLDYSKFNPSQKQGASSLASLAQQAITNQINDDKIGIERGKLGVLAKKNEIARNSNNNKTSSSGYITLNKKGNDGEIESIVIPKEQANIALNQGYTVDEPKEIRKQTQLKEKEKKQNISSIAQLNTLNRTLGEAFNYADKSLSTGIGQQLFGWIGGTDAKALAKKLNTADAITAFDTLIKMKQESPTGGALGSVSEKELELLKSRYTSLDPTLSKEELQKNIQIAATETSDILGRIPNEIFADFEEQSNIGSVQTNNSNSLFR